MQIVIGNVLSAADLERLREALAGARFVDGRETAGFAARTVKHNLQAASDPALDAMRAMVREQILVNEVFGLAVRPKALSLMFSRYEPGMRYGAHVDDAIMHGMRTDVAFTLFVSDPQSYEGGELVIDSAAGEDAIKLPAGALVAYP
ncbi:MAG: Fe2+-dependent dioxygenase, partial [Proteobacteria bacterium]